MKVSWLYCCEIVILLRKKWPIMDFHNTTLKRTVTNLKEVSGRTPKWCMICNKELLRTDKFRSFRPERKGFAELVESCNLVLDININEVRPNSYTLCSPCVTRLKRVEDGMRIKVAILEDFKQTLACNNNRLTLPSTTITPISSPANGNISTTRTMSMSTDQGTLGATRRGHERGAAGTGSSLRLKLLVIIRPPQQVVKVSKSLKEYYDIVSSPHLLS